LDLVVASFGDLDQKAITDLRPDTTTSAPHLVTMSSGRFCADDVGTIASILVIQMEMSFSRWTQMIAQSAIFLSAFPYTHVAQASEV
jgi:hypothetical protein